MALHFFHVHLTGALNLLNLTAFHLSYNDDLPNLLNSRSQK